MLYASETPHSDIEQRAERSEFLRELGTLLGWRSETLVWMLYGHFGESGEHATGGQLIRLTIGGALATFEIWQSLNAEWTAILANHFVETFHAANDKANDALMQAIFRAVDKHSMWLFGTTHSAEHSKKPFKEAYGKGVIDLLKVVHQQAFRESDDCHLFFAEHNEFSIRRIAAYYEKIRDLVPRLNGLTVSKPQTYLPLQLADLVAHAVKCHAEGDDSLVNRLRHRHSFHIIP
jgi:hypothetical protein